VCYTFISFLTQENKNSAFQTAIGVFVTVGVVSICLYYVLQYLETIYVKQKKKPFYIHLYPIRKTLPKPLKIILKSDDFYQSLDTKRKKYFEHRTTWFVEKTQFVGRDGLKVNDAMKMQIAILVIKLTFGMRHYKLTYLQTIILYPKSYYSILNQTKNIGEFNPRSKAIVLSWKHFKKGNKHKDNAKNLGIHEITHAIHYNSIKNNDISSEIFYDTFLKLEEYLGDTEIREKIVESALLRAYAFTDKFEFIAVLIEVFMETPERLKIGFPEIYEYVVQMLNFRYFKD